MLGLNKNDQNETIFIVKMFQDLIRFEQTQRNCEEILQQILGVELLGIRGIHMMIVLKFSQ